MTTITTQSASQSLAASREKSVARVGIQAAVLAAIVNVMFAIVVKDLVGVSLQAGGKAFPVMAFGTMTLLGASVGIVLAVLLKRKAKQPALTFIKTTVLLTAVSLVAPFLLEASAATRITLDIAHILAATIVISMVASRLGIENKSQATHS